MKISIIGSGKVGTDVGMGFKKLGYQIIFYDVVKRECPDFTIDMDYAVNNSDVSFICVPTPTKNRKIDLTYVESATASIGYSLRKKREYHVVVVKSTVVPTTTEKAIIPLLEKSSRKIVGKEFGICVNPEFLTEAHGTWSENTTMSRDFYSQERVVIGEFDKRSGDVVEALYEPLKVPILRTDLKTAELIKYASNCALASRISYWNEIYYICRRLAIDSTLVAETVGIDKRIGRYGTVHGKAFGGKCLPKDLEAFISFVEDLGYNPALLKAVQDVNERIKKDKGVRE